MYHRCALDGACTEEGRVLALEAIVATIIEALEATLDPHPHPRPHPLPLPHPHRSPITDHPHPSSLEVMLESGEGGEGREGGERGKGTGSGVGVGGGVGEESDAMLVTKLMLAIEGQGLGYKERFFVEKVSK